jgi:hypothetical protein
MLGTIDTEADTNTKIIISGNTRGTNTGNIQYYATTTGGNHIFYTSVTPTTRMTISSTGVNVNNNFGVSGNSGFGTAPHSTHRLDILGDVNTSGVYRINGNATCWMPGTTPSNIFYNLGNVSIGINTTSDIDDNTGLVIPTARLYIRGGESVGGTCDVVIRSGVVGQNGGKTRLWLMGDASHATFIQGEHLSTGGGNSIGAKKL